MKSTQCVASLLDYQLTASEDRCLVCGKAVPPSSTRTIHPPWSGSSDSYSFRLSNPLNDDRMAYGGPESKTCGR